MDSFWVTFWGGLMSLAAFSLLAWLLAIIVDRVKKAASKKPHWTLATDKLGRTTFTYHGKKPAVDPHVQLYSAQGPTNTPLGQPERMGEMAHFPKRHSWTYSGRDDWDQVQIIWKDAPDRIVHGMRPSAGEEEPLTATSEKPKLLHRLGGFLMSK